MVISKIKVLNGFIFSGSELEMFCFFFGIHLMQQCKNLPPIDVLNGLQSYILMQ